MEGELTGGTVEEKNTLQDTGLKVKVVSDGNKIFLEDYSRKPEDRMGPTAKLDPDPFRKMTGQVAWLTNSTWPDPCYLVPQTPKKAWMSNRGVMEEQLPRNWVLDRPTGSPIQQGYPPCLGRKNTTTGQRG